MQHHGFVREAQGNNPAVAGGARESSLFWGQKEATKLPPHPSPHDKLLAPCTTRQMLITARRHSWHTCHIMKAQKKTTTVETAL